MPGLGRGAPGTPPGRGRTRGAGHAGTGGTPALRSVKGLLPGRAGRGAPGTAPGTAGRGGASALRSVNGLLPGRGALRRGRGRGDGGRRGGLRGSAAAGAAGAGAGPAPRATAGASAAGASGAAGAAGAGLGPRLRGGLGRGARGGCRGERLAEPPDDRRLDGGARRTDELTHLLELGHDGLALDSELLGELVDPDLRHSSPDLGPGRGRPGPLRRARTRSSLGVHRVLMSCRSRLLCGQVGEWYPGDGTDRHPSCGVERGAGAARTADARARPGPRRRRARPRPAGPWSAPAGVRRGRDRPGRGATTHLVPRCAPGGRGRERPRPRRRAPGRSGRPCPGTRCRCAPGCAHQDGRPGDRSGTSLPLRRALIHAHDPGARPSVLARRARCRPGCRCASR